MLRCFVQLLDTTLLAHNASVDFFGDTVSKSIHTSGGIAKLKFKFSVFPSQNNI